MNVSSVSPSFGTSYAPPSKTDGAAQDVSVKATGQTDENRIGERDNPSKTYDSKGALSKDNPITDPSVPDPHETDKTDQDRNTSTSELGKSDYSSEDQKELEKLEKRNQEVKNHEQAHIAAGGSYVRGGASFEYQTGPDGKRYAVGGEVSIDMSKEPGNPQATIAKMQTIKRAALAPASPSGQDRSVAAKAMRIEMEARADTTNETESGNQPADTPKANSSQASEAYTASMDSSPDRTAINAFA